MQERSHNIEGDTDESEVTLAAPRFDANEARHAHPVVPLDEVPAGSDTRAGRARFRGGAHRRWPLSLIVVSLLAAAALGAVATKVLNRARTTQTPAPASADAAQTQPPQTDTTQPQTTTAPPRADAAAQPQSVPAPTAASVEKTDASKETTEGRAPHRTREERPVRPRQDEVALPPTEAAHAERREADGEDLEQRGHIKGRDGRDEGRDERDSRKAAKRQKRGEARLVDVLVGSPRHNF